MKLNQNQKKNIATIIITSAIAGAVGDVVGSLHQTYRTKPTNVLHEDVNRDSKKDFVIETRSGRKFAFLQTKDGNYELSEGFFEEQAQRERDVNVFELNRSLYD